MVFRLAVNLHLGVKFCGFLPPKLLTISTRSQKGMSLCRSASFEPLCVLIRLSVRSVRVSKKQEQCHRNVICHVCVWGGPHGSYHHELWRIARSRRHYQSFKFWRRSGFSFFGYEGSKFGSSHRKGIWPLHHCHTLPRWCVLWFSLLNI